MIDKIEFLTTLFLIDYTMPMTFLFFLAISDHFAAFCEILAIVPILRNPYKDMVVEKKDGKK